MPVTVTYKRVLEDLAKGASLSEVLNDLVTTAENARPHMLCSILLLDGRKLRQGSAPSLPDFYNEVVDGLEIGPTVGSCGAAAHSGERIIATDLQTHPNWEGFREIAARAGLGACWSQPILTSRNEVLGTFAMYYREPREPDPEDIAFIESAAHLAGIAIELDRNVTALRAARDELEQRVEERTAELEKANETLHERRTFLQTLIDLLPSRIFVKDLESRFLLSNRSHQLRLGAPSPKEVVGHTIEEFLPGEPTERSHQDDRKVLESGEALVDRMICDESPAGRRWFLTTKVPLRDSHGELIGLVGVSHEITARKQVEEQLERVAEELRQKNRQMESDLKMAREIQQACLPHRYPRFPAEASDDESALRFFHRYRPTTTLAGDFFDILALSDHEAGVMICDVMGHGVRASLITALLRGIVEERMPAAENPGEFLEEINRGIWAILRQTGSPVFVTAFYLVVNLEEKTLRYANAGHPSPLRLCRRAESVVPLMAPGDERQPALGVVEDFAYTHGESPLSPEDFILLFTDGIYQSGIHGRAFGEEELVVAVRKRLRIPPEELLDELLEEIREYSGAEEFSDDVCLVGVEVTR